MDEQLTPTRNSRKNRGNHECIARCKAEVQHHGKGSINYRQIYFLSQIGNRAKGAIIQTEDGIRTTATAEVEVKTITAVIIIIIVTITTIVRRTTI